MMNKTDKINRLREAIMEIETVLMISRIGDWNDVKMYWLLSERRKMLAKKIEKLEADNDE